MSSTPMLSRILPRCNMALGEAAHAYEDWSSIAAGPRGGASAQRPHRASERTTRHPVRRTEDDSHLCAVRGLRRRPRRRERARRRTGGTSTLPIARRLAVVGRDRTRVRRRRCTTGARTPRRDVLELEDRMRKEADPLDVLRGNIADFAGVSADEHRDAPDAPTWPGSRCAAEARIELSRSLSAARRALDRSMSAALEAADRDAADVLPFDVIAQVASRGRVPADLPGADHARQHRACARHPTAA